MRECNLKWLKRISAKIRNQSFKITLQPLQDVEGYIAIDRSTVLESVFPLKYEPFKPNLVRLGIVLVLWGMTAWYLNSINGNILDYVKPFLFSLVGLIASYLVKEDLEYFLSRLKNNQATKLTLTGLATIEPVSDKAKEINDKVEKANLEFSNLKPIKK